jgi:uncharacterized GH25 family protein
MPRPPANRYSRWVLIVAAFAMAGRIVAGHEFWLTVASTRLPPGQTVPFTIGFGEHLQSPAAGVDLAAVQMHLTDRTGSPVQLAVPVQEIGVGLIKGAIQVPIEPGFYAIAAAFQGKAISYTASDFQAYLTREQLTSALAFRKALGEEARDAREIVSMFAKCIVRVGTPPADGIPILRSRIELVPVSDPTVLRAGDTFHVRLFFNNGPQADAPIIASGFAGDGVLPAVSGRTNGSGEADLAFSRAGVWVIRAVQVIPRTAHAGEPTEWESYWASLTVVVEAR